MIYADVKVDLKQQVKKGLVAASYNFLSEVPSKHEIKCKTSMYFSFNFGCYSSGKK